MTGRLLRLLRRAPALGPRLIRTELERRYRSVFGRTPCIDAPSGFNEWILHRTLYDRAPRLKVICNKLAAREFIREHGGPQFVVPLLGVWQDPAAIPWGDLPRQFVLKPNHSSGPGTLVHTEAERDPAALAAQAAEWLKHDFFDINFEWGYRNMPRRLLAEPLLTGADGGPLAEAQVFTFHGRASCIRVITGQKLTPSRRENWFDLEARDLRMTARNPVGEYVLAAGDAKTVVELAERLASGFDQLRVDIFLTGDGPKVGELTPYHAAGVARWNPPEWDGKFGRLWAAGGRAPAG